MEVKAPAKINLYLHVKGKRSDGYHFIDSLMVFADICDIINFSDSDNIELELSGEFANDTGKYEDNIVLKAAEKLLQKSNKDNLGVKIHLEKNIPVGAGLGGGSADAAAVLKGLNEFWNLGLSLEVLLNLAVELGADVPVCVLAKEAFVSGIGEELKVTNVNKNMPILLVKPLAKLSAMEVYQSYSGDFVDDKISEDIDLTGEEFIPFLSSKVNSLERAATSLAPEILEIVAEINKQKGCLISGMSGSGTTCFGIFESQEFLDIAIKNINKAHSDWWVRGASLI